MRRTLPAIDTCQAITYSNVTVKMLCYCASMFKININPNRHYLFKVKNGNARKMCEIYSKLKIKTNLSTVNLNRFHTLLWCFQCGLLTSKFRLRKLLEWLLISLTFWHIQNIYLLLALFFLFFVFCFLVFFACWVAFSRKMRKPHLSTLIKHFYSRIIWSRYYFTERIEDGLLLYFLLSFFFLLNSSDWTNILSFHRLLLVTIIFPFHSGYLCFHL